MQRQRQFALQWRNNTDSSAIDFVAVFANYKGLAHQNKAIEWLETTSQTATLNEFFRLWKLAEQGKAIVLDVPFFAQVAIKGEPSFKSKWAQNRTCFTSSMAMCLKYLGAKLSGDDEYYAIVQKYGDTTSWAAQISAARHLGFICQQVTTADFDDVRESLEKGKPLVLGILHRGTEAAPTGGHMIAAIGIQEDGDLIANDPYGSVLDGYTGAVENGRRVVYPRRMMERRWTVEGKNSGWAMLFH